MFIVHNFCQMDINVYHNVKLSDITRHLISGVQNKNVLKKYLGHKPKTFLNIHKASLIVLGFFKNILQVKKCVYLKILGYQGFNFFEIPSILIKSIFNVPQNHSKM